MAAKQNKKVVKYKKTLHINIGIIIFGIIFLYILYYVFSYFTTEKISNYEVTQGTIAQNKNFTGLILRQESIYYAQNDGYLTYYAKDGTKAGAKTFIYSVDANGDFYTQMAEQNDGQLMISDESYGELEKTTDQYLTNYSDNQFYQVYQYKYDMEAALMAAISHQALADMGADGQAAQNFNAFQAQQSGVVAYYTDGLESVTADTFTADMFDPASYNKTNLLGREKISAGDPVYKLITSEYWDVAIPIDETLASDLADTENVKVRFKKDNSTAWATSRIIMRNEAPYLILTFKNSMVRFSMERFVDLELVLTDTSGLKIPNTAITEKDFLTVPKDYITKGGDTDSDGVLMEVTSKNGKVSTQFVRATLFYETDTAYCIDGQDISAGNTVVRPDSTERYTLKDTETLQGVYNINKGYAVFKRIEILFQNEEYTIVNNGTSYGLTLYDHIALDGSIVKEDDIIH